MAGVCKNGKESQAKSTNIRASNGDAVKTCFHTDDGDD